ncbi:MAG: hypothetical protein XXXJIFNMEKO3_02850 [Candidatus Erwinia impunctatus]|nr:hypothetical protein XXXJIFNMEKO_02850 [Culicoides impunctatus]
MLRYNATMPFSAPADNPQRITLTAMVDCAISLKQKPNFLINSAEPF